MDRGAWRLQSLGLHRVGHDQRLNTCPRVSCSHSPRCTWPVHPLPHDQLHPLLMGMLGGGGGWCGVSTPRPCGRAESAFLQKQVCEGQYGRAWRSWSSRSLEHNILQKEIDAYVAAAADLVGPVVSVGHTPRLAPLVPFLLSEPERGLAGPWRLGMGGGAGRPRDVGCILPCTSSLTGPVLSPLGRDRTLATIRSHTWTSW